MAGNQRKSVASWAPRAVAGGVLMGLANLVPGISGGTMLLAVGIYPSFIEAVADTTRLRLRLQPLLLLAVVAASGGLAILLLAGVLRDLVVHHRWITYSAFIGLTLGGLPLVWRLAQPTVRAFWGGAAGGFAVMAGLALLQSDPTATGSTSSGPFLLAVAGAAGAAAMILPGVSGAYLLLALGQYEPILGAIEQVLEGLSGLNSQPIAEATVVLLPVLVGIVVGATVISNAVRFALRRFRQATLGVLMGLLLGAVVGLWPFENPASPAPLQAASALGLAGAGFVLTWTISRLGTTRTDSSGQR
ncbi:MAG: DUF368 domain-containing protein [Holophagales bacterium]|nr:DUF368 domain-containing protein [Holophagales bacterium]MXX60913.1 DUF368 domain-containing protein [Holophagales bacterium]MYC09867.1 DUF368 domain-containing protein [Holophagales bacterium]MYD22389.1 DUF368 domain-containing protein [Holophagales bacterium]MYI33017.1 DUF368 domain-containing protein [Holophagales bacterium]